jgi:hypothetical protein
MWGERSIQVLMGKPEGKNLLEEPGVDARIKGKLMFKKWDGGHELD